MSFVRRLTVPLSVLTVAAGLAVASCSDDGDAVLDQGGDAELAGGSTKCTTPDGLDIPAQICALFDKGTEKSFLARYDNVKRKLGQGKQSVAVTQMLALINSVFDKAGVAADPNGASPPTTNEALADLIEDLFAAIGFSVELDPALFDGGSITVIDESGGTAEAANGFELVIVPPNAVNGPTLIVITPLPDGSDPFPDFFSVPKYFDNTAFPLENGPTFVRRPALAGGPSEFTFEEPVTVALCAVTDDLTEEQADALQLAHDTGDGVEILDPVPPPAGLDCSDAVDESVTALRKRGPASGPAPGGKGAPRGGPALHGGRGVGGQVSSFSPFGAVIAESVTTVQGTVTFSNEVFDPAEGATVDLLCYTPFTESSSLQLAEVPVVASDTTDVDGFYSFTAGEDGFDVGDTCFVNAEYSDEYSLWFGSSEDDFTVEPGTNVQDIVLEEADF
ncbi:MAG TPA: hypothetical protein VIC56_00050 [Gemmatimonadota bacterium]|jgi:hypothetical protein